MTTPQANGYNLGNAYGRIVIDSSGVQRGIQQAQRQFDLGLRSMGQSLQAFGGVLQNVGTQLTLLTAPMLGVGFAGLQQADDLRLLNLRYEELAGSQAEAATLMNEVADAARSMGLPIRETQTAFAGLIPAIDAAGGSYEEYLDLVSRLAFLNPEEGVEGATFAIREALVSGGTDLVSLSERFNIPRSALRELIEETGSFSQALSTLLDEQGATTRAAEASANSLRGAMGRLQDTVRITMEGVFLPLLDDAIANINELTQEIAQIFTPELQARIGELVRQFAPFVVGVSSAGAALAVLGTVLSAVGSLLSTIGMALAAITSPLGLLVVAVAALGYAWHTNFMGIQETTRQVMDYITTTAQPIFETLFNYLGRVWEVISPALDRVRAWFLDDALPGIADFIDTDVHPMIQAFVDLMATIWEIVGPGLGQLADWFVESGLPAIIEFIGGAATTAINHFTMLLRTMTTAITNTLNAITNLINTMRNASQSAQNDIQNMRNAIEDEGAKGAISQGASNIGQFWSSVSGAWRNRAEGGMVGALVGERGPERVLMPAGSQVMPTTQTGGGMPSIENMNIYANSEAEGAAAMRGALSEWEKVMNERDFAA